MGCTDASSRLGDPTCNFVSSQLLGLLILQMPIPKPMTVKKVLMKKELKMMKMTMKQMMMMMMMMIKCNHAKKKEDNDVS